MFIVAVTVILVWICFISSLHHQLSKHLTPQFCLNLSFLSSLFPRKVKTKYYLHTPIASINEIGVAEAINIVTSIAFLIAFAILKIQPVNDIAYFPKWYLKGLRTSSIQTGGFGSKFINLDFMSYVWFLNWMPEALQMPEPELVRSRLCCLLEDLRTRVHI